jgi:hypothetical protein
VDRCGWRKSVFIALGSPYENGTIESFNVLSRGRLLDGEIFCSPKEAQITIEARRRPTKLRASPHIVRLTTAPS